MTETLFFQRQYKEIARVIAEVRETNDEAVHSSLINALIELFEGDNNAFNRTEFLLACGYGGELVPEEEAV